MNAAGSEFLAPYEVQRVLRATGKAARGSLKVIDLLDDKVREFTEYNPRAEQNKIRDQAMIIVLEHEEGLQRQREAEEQQAAADRYKHEQMGRVTKAAHKKQLCSRWILRTACQVVQEL